MSALFFGHIASAGLGARVQLPSVRDGWSSTPGPAWASGGTPLLTGSDQSLKILFLALGSDETENAFEDDRNLGYGHVFDFSDRATQAVIRRRLEVIFGRFVELRRFSLVAESVEFRPGAEGELELSFRYIDLETDSTETFRRRFGAVGFGDTSP